MTSAICKNSGVALACALFIFISACNNSSSNNGSSGTDTTVNQVKQAEGSVEQAADKAATAIKEEAASNPDSSFVADVALSNNEEIKMLQAGIDKGTDKELKTDARMMLKDHEGLKKKLTEYATGKNYPIPADDNGNSDKDLNDMSGKTVSDWDKAWVNFMYNAHEKAIGAFEGAKNKVKDPELQTLITNTLPTLNEHLGMMKKLLDKMK